MGGAPPPPRDVSVVGISCIGDVRWEYFRIAEREIFSCISLYETVYSKSYLIWFENV